MNERRLQLARCILEECLEEHYVAEELLSKIRDALALLNEGKRHFPRLTTDKRVSRRRFDG